MGNQVGSRNAGDGPGRSSRTLLGFPSKDGVADRILRRPWNAAIRKVIENIRLSGHVPASAPSAGKCGKLTERARGTG